MGGGLPFPILPSLQCIYTYVHLCHYKKLKEGISTLCQILFKSGGSAVDNTVDYQSRGPKRSIPRFSGLSDEILN